MSEEKEILKPWLRYLLIFCGIFAFYAFTAPENHSEAEDAYAYARMAEGAGWAEMMSPNRLLGLPVLAAPYRLMRSVGLPGRAFPAMIFFNRLAATLALIFFYRFLRMALTDGRGALQGTLLLAFSYGFWRYANEVEVYMLSAAVLAFCWAVAVDLRPNMLKVCGGGLAAGFGVLLHLLNMPALLLALPVYYGMKKRWKALAVHVLLAGAVTAAGYLAAVHVLDWNQLGSHHHQLEAGISPVNIVRGSAALAQNAVGVNFLFGYEWFRGLVEHLFPSRMLEEEFFMGQLMLRRVRLPASILFFTLPVAAGILLHGLWARRRQIRPLTRLEWAGFLWFGLYAGAVVLTESGSPELWLLALLPLIFFGIVLMSRLELNRPLWVLVVLLPLYNYFAGLLPVMPAETDYYARKCEWFVREAGSDDVILTSYLPLQIAYLEYFTDARIVNTAMEDRDSLDALFAEHCGRVFAVPETFSVPRSMRVRNPYGSKHMDALGQWMKPRFERIYPDRFGGIWQLKNSSFEL